MYHVQGGDHREYGPLTADQVRQWIREHRLDRNSPARRPDEETWRTLGEFPEFSADLSGAGLVESVPPAPADNAAEREAALNTARPPGIALLVTGILTCLTSVPNFFVNPSTQTEEMMREFEKLSPQMDESMRTLLESMMQFQSGSYFTLSSILSLVIGIMLVIGGVKLMGLRSYGLVMTAAILALLPCASCCCIGIPVGIWALIVMNKPEVKPHFR